MYKDLEKRFGKRLVDKAIRQIKSKTNRHPAYVEILAKLLGIK